MPNSCFLFGFLQWSIVNSRFAVMLRLLQTKTLEAVSASIINHHHHQYTCLVRICPAWLQPRAQQPQRRLASTEPVAAVATAAGVDGTTSASWIANLWQGVSNSTPVHYMQDGLVAIHDFTGLPWWATIVMSTIIFRSVITLPLTIYQHKITARLERISLEMPAIVEELKREAAMAKQQFKWSDEQTRLVFRRSIKKQWTNLIVRDNCHPAKTFIVLWGQIPLWICQSVALRNLVHMLPNPQSLDAKIIFTELSIGGFGWIPNLTEVDHSYILPVTLGLINLAIIELQSMSRTRPRTRLQRYATNTFRGLSVLMVPVACTVPSALCVYWVASSSYGLAQNLLMLSPTVRRAVGIPQTNSELIQPYQHIWHTWLVRTGQVKEEEKAAPPMATKELPLEPKEPKEENKANNKA